jgi:hypothetical protein
MTERKHRHRGIMVWRCPTCSRRVPREQEQCACGYMKAWRPAVAADTTRRSGSLAYQILVVAMILAAAMLGLLTLLR